MADAVIEAPAAALAPTAAEQAGAERLKGALDREALDAAARGMQALGLKSYSLSNVSYTVPREGEADQTVSAVLRYGKQAGGVSWRRTVTLNAMTGALISVSSSGWMQDKYAERSVGASAARTAAEAFLKEQCGAQFAKTSLYQSTDALSAERLAFHSFTFAQMENGCFFPDNSIQVDVDATDGSIAAYRKVFDDTVAFDSAEGVMDPGQAVDIWLGTYMAKLQYVRVPAAVDYSQPEYSPLKDLGVAYLYQLVLGYKLERETAYAGLDAKTGQPVRALSASQGEMAYADLEGCWARDQIEALAQYRVGYAGGRFRPDNALTQIDLVALLASTQGYLYDETAAGAADSLYEYARSAGILRQEAREDGRVLTRMDTIRLILSAFGYEETASLQGIFRTRFADAGSIPAADLGYAALAQGLGMVSGDSQGRLLPNQTASRAHAAVMLYNLLAR